MVSVIMSVYKEPLFFLEESINSILKQTYTDLEVIIVLDNPDNREICQFLERKKLNDSRIVLLINPRNMGLVYSLNRALKECKGDYIARMDADDISHLNRIEKQLYHLTEGNYDLVGSTFSTIDENGRLISSHNCYYSDECIKKILLVKNCIAHPSWFAKKSLFDQLNGYRNINYSEDYDFLLRSIYLGKSISICNQDLLYYRINSKGISKTNMFAQYAVTHYLSNSKRKIFNLKPEIVNQFINNESNKYRERFMHGILCSINAKEAFKENKRLKALFWRAKSVFTTKYNVFMIIDSYKENRLRSLNVDL